MLKIPKVLVLGWEFPPHVEGGLAGATFGLVNAMQKNALITLILPKYTPSKIWKNVMVIGLNHSHSLIEKSLRKKSNSKKESNQRDSISIFDKLAGPYPHTSSRVNQSSKNDSISNFNFEENEIENNAEDNLLNKLNWFSSKDVYGFGIWGQMHLYKNASTLISKELSFDIIHAHDWVTFLAGVCIKNSSKKPLALHIHSLETDRINESVRNEIYDIEKYSMQKADIIFAVSEYTKNKIIELYQINAEKISVVHNGITVYEEPERWFHPLNKQIVAYIGRITSQKGTHLLMEIAERVVKAKNDVLFVIAGKGDSLPYIMTEAARKRLSGNIVFTGFLRPDEVDRLLATADVYFMPSVSEPFGLSALEAVRAGTPCVISKQSGVAEVLPNSFKADFWDVEKFSELILQVLNSKDEKDMWQRKESKKLLKNISWTNASDKILNEYKNILN